MSLSPGTKLAHYEIVEPIGKGGMGEVYRARDGKLGRDVAIKVLPDDFAKDEERLRRFQREAKVLASLNHPNIAAIYGLEQSDKTHYLVLELVPGETLAERIARGPIPVEEALEISAKIAEALEEAHEQGIVHRDLKPANIKQTENGKIKVLDYGLAKVFQEETAEADTSMSLTLTRDATRVGVILGTAAYMSPEQAKGKRVDKRTDIFAFGAVLFEMLTGQRAFAGEDVSDTLAAVLRAEPDWNLLPRKSPAVRQVLRLCLTKDPKQRVRDMGDVRLAMEGAFETEAATEASVAAPAKLALWQRPLPALILGLMMAGLVVWSVTRPPTSALRVSRASMDLPQTQTRTNTGRRGVAVSPRGTHVVYVANQQLYLRAIDEMDAKALGGTEGSAPTIPFFSPDGQWIGFYSMRDSQLKKIALTGGAAVKNIVRGIGFSLTGVVVLSPRFFDHKKTWTKKELELISASEGDTKVVLPVLHEMSLEDLRKSNPDLAELVGVKTEDGVDKVVEAIVREVETIQAQKKMKKKAAQKRARKVVRK